MNKQILVEEQITLDLKVIEIESIIQALRDELKNSASKDINLERTNRKFISQYIDAKKKPYFARIDTYENGQKETFYIGNTGIAKDKHEDIVYSWKSSIGDLFYQFNGGESNVVIEKENGNKYPFQVLFKRTLDIENLKVKKYADVVSNLAADKTVFENNNFLFDDFLMDLLNNRSNETQLKDIIMTIQKEQNDIIRLPLDKSVIVQGVAGSGKSSIALSRISYLLSRYPERIKPEDIVILAPNEMFIQYIQTVLPTLEIENIPQLTFLSLASLILEDLSFKQIIEPTEILGDVLNGKENLINKEKNSIIFKEKIDNYLNEFEQQFISNLKEFKCFDPFLQKSYVLSKEKMLEKYNDLKGLSLIRKNNETLKYVERWADQLLSSRLKELEDESENLIDVILTGIPGNSSIRSNVRNAVEKAYETKLKLFREEINNSWKNYKSSWMKFELYSTYKRILELEEYQSLDVDNNKIINLNNFKKNLRYDDLAPLIYIDSILNGVNKKYQHIVVDEAQDLNAFQIYILKELSNSMTLLGDLTQSIYLEHGLNSWDELIDEVFQKEKLSFMEINTSYRSTDPIMETSNLVIKNGELAVPKIIPIGRTGDKIIVEKIHQPPKLIENIINTIKDLQKKGFKKIAVVHKDLIKSTALYQHLLNKFTSLQLITNSSQTVIEDVIIIPSYLTKGLEFDAVIIPNANDKNYGKNELDAKLLFVTLTRAQHYVKIFYHQDLSLLLNGVEMEDIVEEDLKDYSFL